MSTKTLHVTFGRMNPPTVAHIQLIERMTIESDRNFMVYLSNTHDMKNPLTFEERLIIITEMYGSLIHHIRPANNIFDAMDDVDAFMQERGYENVVLWCGTDRLSAFQRVLLYPSRWKFTVSEIRELPRDGSDVSATAVRTAVVNRDTSTFSRMAACAYSRGAWLFETLYERLTDGRLESKTKTSKR